MIQSTFVSRLITGVIAKDGGSLRSPITAQECLGAAAQKGWGQPNAFIDADNDTFLDLDPSKGDTCGDLSQTAGPVRWVIDATVKCTGITTAGLLAVPSCRIWEQNVGGQHQPCTSFNQAGTGSKCDCTALTLIGLEFGKITVRKQVVGVPGLFNLLIDGVVNANNVGNGGFTPAVDVNTGTHNVSETAGTNTNLNNYVSVYACTCSGPCNGGTTVSGSGISFNLNVGKNDDWICTFTNTVRKYTHNQRCMLPLATTLLLSITDRFGQSFLTKLLPTAQYPSAFKCT
jgi:hypothetical protein